jgi:hypothetical protein
LQAQIADRADEAAQREAALRHALAQEAAATADTRAALSASERAAERHAREMERMHAEVRHWDRAPPLRRRRCGPDCRQVGLLEKQVAALHAGKTLRTLVHGGGGTRACTRRASTHIVQPMRRSRRPS